VDRPRPSLSRRIILAFAGVEVLFKVLVGLSYLDLAGAQTSADRFAAGAWYLGIAAPFTAAFFTALGQLLAPVRRWEREERAGEVSDATLCAAGEALFRLPITSPWRWMLAWSAATVTVWAVRGVTCFEAGALFLTTMITGPVPVGRAVASWIAAPGMRRAALAARDRGLTLVLPALPLRRRLAEFGFLIAIAPTTYVASYAFTAQVTHASIDEMLVRVAVCGVAVIAFGVICAWLKAASITANIAAMAGVIRDIAGSGEVGPVARVPQLLRDEVGGLAASINEMIGRLERAEAERSAMSDSLASLNQALERRVLERTMRLFEANSVLQAEMAARAKVEIELRHAQKLEAVGRLSAGIAHEINTPVQFVSDSISFIASASADLIGLVDRYRQVVRAVRDAGPACSPEATTAAAAAETAEVDADFDYIVAELPSALDLARDGLGRVKDIVRSMKIFAHHDQDMRDADLNQAIRSTLTIAHHEYKYVADVELELGEIPLVHCHAGEINQVVLNLLVNAAHAIADRYPGGTPRGRIGISTAVDGDSVVIAISDTGSGIPEDIRDRIFDPFFTTKEVDRGTGQGLAIARSVVAEKHGGSLTFTTELGAGTTFTIRLPIRGKRAAAPAANGAPAASPAPEPAASPVSVIDTPAPSPPVLDGATGTEPGRAAS
jgi:signal transduction histidine kinase